MKPEEDRGPEGCDWAAEELSESASAPDDRRRLEAHLASCPRCREDSEWHRRLAGILGAASPAQASGGIERRVRALLRRRRAARWASAAAAVAAIGGASVFLAPEFLGRSPSAPPAVARPSPESPPAASGPSSPADFPASADDLAFLAAAPPVAPQDPSQAAWIAVLTEACQGDLK